MSNAESDKKPAVATTTAGLRGSVWNPARLPKDTQMSVHTLRTHDGANVTGYLFRRGGEKTVCCWMHPREIGVSNYLVPDVLDAGAAAWVMGARSPGNDIRLEHESAVLDLAAAKAGWERPLPKVDGLRLGRGVALGTSMGTLICAIVEVGVTAQGDVRLRRAVVAADCGQVVNPNTVEAQLQGGLVFGLSAALSGDATVRDGRIEQGNFHDYRVLRMNETPVIEGYMVPSTESPTGIGEPPTAIAPPALANAVFAATGVRVRRLPIAHTALAASSSASNQVVI